MEMVSASCEIAICCFYLFERFTSRYEENQANSTAGEEEPFALSLLCLTIFIAGVFVHANGSHTVLKTFRFGMILSLYLSS